MARFPLVIIPETFTRCVIISDTEKTCLVLLGENSFSSEISRSTSTKVK